MNKELENWKGRLKIKKINNSEIKMLENYIEDVEKGKKRIYNIGRFKYHLREDVLEDIYQDTFLSLMKGKVKYNSNNAKFLTWFTKCFLNKCVDYLRATNKVRIIRTTSLSNFFYRHSENFEENNSNNIDIETLNKIVKQVNELNPKLRDVVRMYYGDNMKYIEIAERLNVSIYTIKSRLKKAKGKLKIKLKTPIRK
mgnify:CR=1 FL=1